MPSKADPEKQATFMESVLKPAIENAKAGFIELFFMDASHFVMGGSPGRLWGKIRHWVKTCSGRKRYNVLGALNFLTKKIETVANDSYITSVQVVQLLEDIAIKYIGAPIAIILDNAKYQRCELVTNKAAELGIRLIFLPSYSPNLNLIERVWKFVKSQVLNAVYIETFGEYCERIANFMQNIEVKYSDRMASLVTEKFQLFNESNAI